MAAGLAYERGLAGNGAGAFHLAIAEVAEVSDAGELDQSERGAVPARAVLLLYQRDIGPSQRSPLATLAGRRCVKLSRRYVAEGSNELKLVVLSA